MFGGRSSSSDGCSKWPPDISLPPSALRLTRRPIEKLQHYHLSLSVDLSYPYAAIRSILFRCRQEVESMLWLVVRSFRGAYLRLLLCGALLGSVCGSGQSGETEPRVSISPRTL